MASLILPLATTGATTASGAPLSGGIVFLTVPGTSNTSVTGFTDRDASAAHVLSGGGIRLDAAGKAEIYVNAPCDMRFEDASGLTVATGLEPSVNAALVEVLAQGWTGISPVTGQYVTDGTGRTKLDTALASIYASLGGVDGKYRGVYGTSDRALRSQIEAYGLMPQQFGAKGDGVTDDTVAFGLLAQAQAASGLPIFIPAGLYQLSAVTTFAGHGVIIHGAGRGNIATVPPTGGAVLRGTNATMNLLAFTGASPVLENLTLTHSATSTGTALTFSTGVGSPVLRSVFIVLGTYDTALSNSTLEGHAVDTNVFAITTATVGAWRMSNPVGPIGAVSATTVFAVNSVLSTGVVAQRATVDMANGGNVTPTASGTGIAVAYQRIRGTSAGAGTVNATSVPATGAEILILDLFNNSGGAFTFNLAAQYHGSTAAPAPANGQRIVCSYAWNTTEAIWVMTGVTASFA
jgi:Pectate lyase superfamily protein